MPSHGASRSRVGMPYYQSFLRHRTQSLHQPTLSGSWICSVNNCRLLPIQRENVCVSLNPPVPLVVRKRILPMWRRRPRKWPALMKACPRLRMCGNCLEKGVRSVSKGGKAEEAADCSLTPSWPRRDPTFIAPSWFSAPPGLALPAGSRPDYWRNELLYRGGDVENHPGPERALLFRKRNVLLQEVASTIALRCDVAVSGFEKCLRVRNIHEP